jgi:hypothetical protein
MIIMAVAEAAKIATSPATEYHTATVDIDNPDNKVIHGINLSANDVCIVYYLRYTVVV